MVLQFFVFCWSHLHTIFCCVFGFLSLDSLYICWIHSLVKPRLGFPLLCFLHNQKTSVKWCKWVKVCVSFQTSFIHFFFYLSLQIWQVFFHSMCCKVIFCRLLLHVLVFLDFWSIFLSQYGVVLDAGSSHTSMYIYKWPADKQNDTGIVTQHSECHVKGECVKWIWNHTWCMHFKNGCTNNVRTCSLI